MKVEDYIASGILEQFVLGELSAAETAHVVMMAEHYPEVRQEIILIEHTLLGMAGKLAVKPPKDVLDKIKVEILEQENPALKAPTSRKNKKINYLQYGLAASFTLKLVAMAVAAHFWINWQHTENSLVQMQEQYDNLQQEALVVTQALIAASDPDFQTVVLKGSDPDNRVLVYWNEETQDIYINPYRLPGNNESQQYQLWGIVEGNTVSLGVFDIARRSSLPQIIPMEGVEELSGFVITLEPKGGSSSPTLERQCCEGKVE